MQTILTIVSVFGVFATLGWLLAKSWKWARNRNGHPHGAVANALQELDRLVARPSIENVIETESEVQAVDDEQGGE